MQCKHNIRRLDKEIWYCTKCPKQWISYLEGNDLYQQIQDLKKELAKYKQTFRILQNRLNLTLEESGINTIRSTIISPKQRATITPQ